MYGVAWHGMVYGYRKFTQNHLESSLGKSFSLPYDGCFEIQMLLQAPCDGRQMSNDVQKEKLSQLELEHTDCKLMSSGSQAA